MSQAAPTTIQADIDKDLLSMCVATDGITLFTGGRNEGVQSTVASMVRYIIENDTPIKGTILTYEQPIEEAYDNIKSEHPTVDSKASGVSQRSIFDESNASAMRRSPDLVLLGELDDTQTINAAIELSLTGHPVFARSQELNISSAIALLVSKFAAEEQPRKLLELIGSLRVVVAQTLIWNTKKELMPVREVLLFTPELREHLMPLARNPQVLFDEIAKIIDNGLFDSKGFKGQACQLLEQEVIDEAMYNHILKIAALNDGEMAAGS